MSWRGGRGRGAPRRGRGGFRSDMPPMPVHRGRDPAIQARENIIFLADQEDFDVIEDIPALARYLRDKWPLGAVPGILDGFAWGITEQPQKLPYYAALLLVLSKQQHYLMPVGNGSSAIDKKKSDATSTGPSAGPAEILDEEALVEASMNVDDNTEEEKTAKIDLEQSRKENCLSWHIITDLVARFRGWIDKREWLNIRLAVSFFGHLVPYGLISAGSYLATLKSFVSVLEELGGGGRRAEKVVRIVTEGLIRAGDQFYTDNKTEVDELISTISSTVTSRDASRAINDCFLNFAQVARGEVVPENDQLDNTVAALKSAQANGFTPIKWMPAPAKRFANTEDSTEVVDPVHIPEVSIPPEDEGESTLSRALEGEGLIGAFSFNGKIGLTDGRVPDPSTPDGITMQSLILDIISIYEVNRVKCASLLLKLTDFCLPDTFREKPTPGEEEAENVSVPGEWLLSSTTISIILSAMFRLPKSPHHVIYLTSVVRELCLANGQLMAPPVGLAMRNLYAHLDQGLDIEVSRRTAEWFSVHLSNFAFQWMWKAWVPDLDLPMTHPKRAFMHRLIELEIRLAYQERILDTLPEEMQDEKSAPALQMPEPAFVYEESDHPLHEDANHILDMLNLKDSWDTILARLRELSGCTNRADPIPLEYRRLAIHCILHIGSRSFSHFLNATERYLKLIQELSQSDKARRELLVFIRDFWKNSGQMRVMVIDKYLQYDLVDSEDVVTTIFGEYSQVSEDTPEDWPTIWTDYHAWELLSNTLVKCKGRLMGIGRRITQTEKEDEAARARNASMTVMNGSEMPVDGLVTGTTDDDMAEDAALDIQPEQVSKEVTALLKRRGELENDQAKLITLVVTKFVQSLVPGQEAQGGLPSSLPQMIEGNHTDPLVWDTVARFGFYREFMRSYAADIKPNAMTLEKVFADLPESVDATADSSRLAARLVRIVYEQATMV